MPSFERGVYEPPSDDIRVFDDEEQDLDEEGSRLPLLIVIALLVLAAFAGVVWLAYSQGVQRGRSDAPRMIVSEPGPVKEAAASLDSGHTLKIYEQPAPKEDSKNNLSAKSEATPELEPASPSVATAATASHAAPKMLSPTKAPVVAVAPEAKPSVVTSKVVPSIQHKASDAPSAPVTAAPRPVETDQTSKPAVSDGSYVLQIGAYKSKTDADAAWKDYQVKHPVAAGYAENVRRADLGDKGIWYRLRIGSFADKDSASTLCDKLKADGGTCLLAK